MRVALYSPGMVGLGHMRRSLLIAQALVRGNPQLAALFIGESREAGALAIPERVDVITLPAVKKGADGHFEPRYLDIPMKRLTALRTTTINAVLEAFDPDALIVDHLPRGACHELDGVLPRVRARGTRVILGLRDVLETPEIARREWAAHQNERAIDQHVDEVWVYGDPRICDHAREYGWRASVAAKLRYVGYLDQRDRLAEVSAQQTEQIDGLVAELGPFVMCSVGGGSDGVRLALAFAGAALPHGMSGVILTGPYMPRDAQAEVQRMAARNPRLRVVEFLPEPTALLARAARIVCMGGYNSVCEALSFGVPTLLIPRAEPRQEQSIRAERLRELGLLDVLPMEAVTSAALGGWLTAPAARRALARDVIDMNGMSRLTRLLGQTLRPPRDAAPAPADWLGALARMPQPRALSLQPAPMP